MRGSAFFSIAAILCASSAVGGCFIITGGTDDYQLADSGSSGGPAIAESCLTAADCDAGEICCLSASVTALASACQVGPCAEAQLCTGNTECGSGKTCGSEKCSSSGVTVTLQACGTIPGCSP